MRAPSLAVVVLSLLAALGCGGAAGSAGGDGGDGGDGGAIGADSAPAGADGDAGAADSGPMGADLVSPDGAGRDTEAIADGTADAADAADVPPAALAGTHVLTLRLDLGPALAGPGSELVGAIQALPGWQAESVETAVYDALRAAHPAADEAAAQALGQAARAAVAGRRALLQPSGVLDLARCLPDAPAGLNPVRLVGDLDVVAQDGARHGEVRWAAASVPTPFLCPTGRCGRGVGFAAELAAWAPGLALTPSSFPIVPTDDGVQVTDISVALDADALALFACSQLTIPWAAEVEGFLLPAALAAVYDCAAALADVPDETFAAAGATRAEVGAACDAAVAAELAPLVAFWDELRSGRRVLRLEGTAQVAAAAGEGSRPAFVEGQLEGDVRGTWDALPAAGGAVQSFRNTLRGDLRPGLSPELGEILDLLVDALWDPGGLVVELLGMEVDCLLGALPPDVDLEAWQRLADALRDAYEAFLLQEAPDWILSVSSLPAALGDVTLDGPLRIAGAGGERDLAFSWDVIRFPADCPLPPCEPHAVARADFAAWSGGLPLRPTGALATFHDETAAVAAIEVSLDPDVLALYAVESVLIPAATGEPADTLESALFGWLDCAAIHAGIPEERFADVGATRAQVVACCSDMAELAFRPVLQAVAAVRADAGRLHLSGAALVVAADGDGAVAALADGRLAGPVERADGPSADVALDWSATALPEAR